MARARRDQKLIKLVKTPNGQSGELCCAVCGWTPPKGLAALGADTSTMIHAHHVKPLSCGGHDVLYNLILVCPTHHAIAHRLGRMYKRYGKMRWDGPSDPDQVIKEIRMMEQEPERFLAYVADGRHYGRLCDEEYAELLRADEARDA